MRARAAVGLTSTVALGLGLAAGMALGGRLGGNADNSGVDASTAPVQVSAPKQHEPARPPLETTLIATRPSSGSASVFGQR